MRMASLAALTFLLLAGPALADTLHLKDGTKFEGQVISDSGGILRFRTAGGVLEFAKDKVDRVEKGKTRAEEFAERRKAIPEGDVPALLDLARWCAEEKLPAQRRKTLQEIVRLCPDHPETRRDLGQAHSKGAWVDVKTPPPAPKLEPGEKATAPDSPFSAVVMKGWAITKEAGRLTAKGPARYATPPVLSITHGPPANPPLVFGEEGGWEKPVEAKAGPATGSRSRRPFVEGHIARTEWVAVFPWYGREVVLRLTCLAMEADLFAPAFEKALATLELAMPKAEYVNATYKYQLDRPKPDGEWTWAETEDHDLYMQREADDAEGIAMLSIISGDPGKEFGEVAEMADGLMNSLPAEGQVLKDAEIMLAGEKGRLVEGTTLMDGIPVLVRLLRVEHRGRIHFIHFTRHEHGKTTDAAWETILSTFAFTD
ncbi:MAG: hypothetical protein MUE73_17665 [Planctomycetes bacterium]|nr:hypothetical protein [Planctomycetota bacterium]